MSRFWWEEHFMTILILLQVCNLYSELDAWDLHEFGYKSLNVVTKLRILKVCWRIVYIHVMCNLYSELDAWGRHEFGYKSLNVAKVRILMVGRRIVYIHVMCCNCRLEVLKGDNHIATVCACLTYSEKVASC